MATGRKKRADQTKAYRSRAYTKLKALNEAALNLVNEKAKEIVQSLYNSTIEGHVQSTRLLVELAEGNVEAEEAMEMRPLRSFALDLAAEREWPGEVAVAAAETGVGSREPEGA